MESLSRKRIGWLNNELFLRQDVALDLVLSKYGPSKSLIHPPYRPAYDLYCNSLDCEFIF